MGGGGGGEKGKKELDTEKFLRHGQTNNVVQFSWD